jgi:hypothetical protein
VAFGIAWKNPKEKAEPNMRLPCPQSGGPIEIPFPSESAAVDDRGNSSFFRFVDTWSKRRASPGMLPDRPHRNATDRFEVPLQRAMILAFHWKLRSAKRTSDTHLLEVWRPFAR